MTVVDWIDSGKSIEEPVKGCASEVAEAQGLQGADSFTKETSLFGSGGLFDSHGLVMLVVAIEQAVEAEYGVHITLADEKAMSQTRSPFTDPRII